MWLSSGIFKCCLSCSLIFLLIRSIARFDYKNFLLQYIKIATDMRREIHKYQLSITLKLGSECTPQGRSQKIKTTSIFQHDFQKGKPRWNDCNRLVHGKTHWVKSCSAEKNISSHHGNQRFFCCVGHVNFHDLATKGTRPVICALQSLWL